MTHGGQLIEGSARVGPDVMAQHRWRSREWATVAALSVTETVSWGVLYYAFAVFQVPMQRELGYSTAQLTGAFSAALLVSGIAGIAAGRYLDRNGPRALMTIGSIGGVVLVLMWSRVHSLEAFYALWLAIGLVMAAVLYETAFTVLAKSFARADERRRAMTALTLVAALASFIFLPLSQALIDAYGWRDALVVLATILGAVTIPLHAGVLRSPTSGPGAAATGDPPGSVDARKALRSRQFWRLTVAFFLASITAIAMIVHAIPFLLHRGYSATFAAFAVGLVGISQVPGRLLFAPMAARTSSAKATASTFALIALGVAVIVSVDDAAAVLVGLVLLGMGNGMATLSRATGIADLFGSGSYGTIAGVTAAMTTSAMAVGPFAAAVWAATVGYDALLWTLVLIAAIASLLAYRA